MSFEPAKAGKGDVVGYGPGNGGGAFMDEAADDALAYLDERKLKRFCFMDEAGGPAETALDGARSIPTRRGLMGHKSAIERDYWADSVIVAGRGRIETTEGQHMADEAPINLVLEHLKAIRAENAKTHERLNEIIGRIAAIEEKTGFIFRDIARVATP